MYKVKVNNFEFKERGNIVVHFVAGLYTWFVVPVLHKQFTIVVRWLLKKSRHFNNWQTPTHAPHHIQHCI